MNAKNIIKSDFLDILFDGRNKDYGAYDLRRNEDKRVRNALIGTASVALVIIGGYVLNNNLMAAGMHTRIVVNTHPIPPMVEPLEPEKPPVTPPPPAVSTPPPPASSSIRIATPTVVEDDLVRIEDEVPKMDSVGTKSIGLANTVGDDVNGVDEGLITGQIGGRGSVVEAPKGEGRETIRTFVEIMPAFPGGEAALARFLQKNMRYPHMAQENGIEGKVFVQFVVNYEGKISDVQTVGAAKGGGLEEEAMRVVRLMPAWKPGKQNGEAVSVRFSLPVGFKLDN